jgi:hypothetical protein
MMIALPHQDLVPVVIAVLPPVVPRLQHFVRARVQAKAFYASLRRVFISVMNILYVIRKGRLVFFFQPKAVRRLIHRQVDVV